MKTPEEKREDARERTKEIADEFAAKGDAFGWFDALYSEADGNMENIPWADMKPNRFLADFAAKTSLTGNGRKALVVGCGLGDDARFLFDLGFKVSAFDISPKAIEWARKLHKDTDIQFEVMDLFDPRSDWLKAFDLVVEVYTIQPLPMDMRKRAIDAVAAFVTRNGRLVAVCRGREDNEEVGEVPCPLARHDLARFEANGLTQTDFREFLDKEDEQRRFLIEFRRD